MKIEGLCVESQECNRGVGGGDMFREGSLGKSQHRMDQSETFDANEDAASRCECCRHLPPPPPPQQARQDLVKQLGLYLKLCSVESADRSPKPNSNSNISTLKFQEGQDAIVKQFQQINRSTSFVHTTNLKSNAKTGGAGGGGKYSYAGGSGANSSSNEVSPEKFAGHCSTLNKIASQLSRNNEFFEDDDDSNLKIAMIARKNKLRPLIPFFTLGGLGDQLNEPLIGREWIFKEIEKAFESQQFVFIGGQAGTGKTKISNHLFKLSSPFQSTSHNLLLTSNPSDSSSSSSFSKTSLSQLNKYHTLNQSVSSLASSSDFNFVNLQTRSLATHLAGVHFCLADDSRTLDIAQFLHNMAWCLANFEGFNVPDGQSPTNKKESSASSNAYLQLLNAADGSLMKKLVDETLLRLEPETVLDKCLIEPLQSLVSSNKLQATLPKYVFFLVDGLDTCISSPCHDASGAAFSIAKFLFRVHHKFPKWFKFLVTIRSEPRVGKLIDEAKSSSSTGLGYQLFSLDGSSCYGSTNNSSASSSMSASMTNRMKNSTSSFSSLDENSSHSNGGNTSLLSNESNSSGGSNAHLSKDLTDYIAHRISRSADIQKNILSFNCINIPANESGSSALTKSSICSAPPSSSPTLNYHQPMTSSSFSYKTNPFHSQSASSSSQMSSVVQSNCTLNKSDLNLQSKFIQYLYSLSQNSFLFVKLVLDLIEKGSLVIKSSNFKVLPRSMDELVKLHFNLKFAMRISYDRWAAHIFAICLASFKPLTLNEIYETINCAYYNCEKISWSELMDQMTHLDGFLSPFRYFDPDFDRSLAQSPSQLVRTPSYRFTHPAIRDWWIENQFRTTTHSSPTSQIYDLRWGHFLLGMRLFRSQEFCHSGDLKSPRANKRTYVDLLRHLVISNEFFNENSARGYKLLVYMLSLCLPVEKGAQSNASRDFYTSLLTSVEFISSPEPHLFRLLLDLNADVNAAVAKMNNVPFVCVLARLGLAGLLNILVKEFNVLFDCSDSAAVKCKDHQETNCLQYAVQHGHTECARIILDNSLDPIGMIVHQNSSGNCAMTQAAAADSSANAALLDLFIERVGPLVGKNASCLRAVQQSIVLCAANASVNSLRTLVRRFVLERPQDGQISIDAVDSVKGETALTAACTSGHKNVCEMLIESANASLLVANQKSWTPLLCAVKSGEWEIVEYLLARNHEVIDQGDKHGRTALIMAASEGHLAIIDILLEKGANRACHDRDGLSCLSWACLKGHYNAALALLNNGVDVNHADYSGRTPLDLATFYGDVRLVQLLVERGAQLDHVDNIGMRPLDRAIGCRNVPVVIFFLKKGAKLSPATWAMAAGKPEIIITLLNKLVEDGNTLYRKGCYEDALHRYSYTLKKFPKDPAELAVQPNNIKAIIEMKFNLLLNLARCHRKLEDYQASIDLCSKAIEIKQDSYEAFYSRARAKRDAKQLDSALDDLHVALQLCPTNSDIKKLITKINEEKASPSSALNGTMKKEKQLIEPSHS